MDISKRQWLIIILIAISMALAVGPMMSVHASGTGYCPVVDPCWQVGVQTARDDTVEITFIVTPLCKDVSYVAFGFPDGVIIINSANGADGATYSGPLTGIEFTVSVPASGQVPGNAIKYTPTADAWQPGMSERFTVVVKGLAPDAEIMVYLHAGNGPAPIALPSAPLCGPNAHALSGFGAQDDGQVQRNMALFALVVATLFLVAWAAREGKR